jgi:hypothetical protein
MSRILDALANAEAKRHQNGIDDSRNGSGVAGKGLEQGGFGDDAWRATAGDRGQVGAAVSKRRFRERKSLHYCYSAGLVVALGIGIILGRYLGADEKPEHPRQEQFTMKATTDPGVSPAVPDKGHLPSSILLGAEDLGYSASHPGWRRYPAGSCEFRLFREGTSIKAVQVLALRKEPLPESVLNTFFARTAGQTPYRSSLKENKNGFQIEKGRLGSLAEIVTYRKIPTGELRALVVVYPHS